MEAPTLTPAPSKTAYGVLPIVLAALVAPTDDPRQFRRYALSQEIGIGPLSGDQDAQSKEHAVEQRKVHPPTSRFSVQARDLSLTGLYFISAVPFRVGLQMEIQLGLGRRLVTLPSVVRRLEAPARTELGALETAFGCGVHFLQAQMTSEARRAVMEYLVGQPT